MPANDFFLRSLSKAYMLIDRRPRVTVVTYHRVQGASPMPPADLERQLGFLARHFRTVLPSELNGTNDGGRLAIVTIDDGHADIYARIYPVARKVGVPIAICLPTDFAFRNQWLWFDKIAWAVENAPPDVQVDMEGRKLIPRSAGSVAKFKAYLKRLPPQRRQPVIDQLLAELKLGASASPPAEYRALSRLEMREMLNSGMVELVGHTITHTVATALEPEQLMEELTQSKEELEAFTRGKVPSFCYPNGEPGDFNEHTRAALLKAGYRCAFTSLEGTNLTGQMDPMALRRIHTHPRRGVFAKLVSGLDDVRRTFQKPNPAA